MSQNKNALISINDESENVRVAVRVRPLNRKELKEDVGNIASINEDNNVISLAKPGLPDEAPKSFKFDFIFPESCTQVIIFKLNPNVDLINHILDGFIQTYSIPDCGEGFRGI